MFGEGVTDNQWIKVRDAVKYTTMHKNKTVATLPQIKKYLVPNVNSAEVEKPKLRYDFLAFLWKVPGFSFVPVNVMFSVSLFP